MNRYDSSKTGKLSKAELAALLKVHTVHCGFVPPTRPGADTKTLECVQDQAGGVELSAEELDFVLHTAVRPLRPASVCSVRVNLSEAWGHHHSSCLLPFGWAGCIRWPNQ